jgi:microcystin-dependent protein
MAYDNVFVGQILVFPFNFAPKGFAQCQGQLLPISLNTALFSLLGTTYGGNGKTTFALPDLRGRVPLKFGQGPGLTAYSLGETGGFEAVTLAVNQLPQHAHTLDVSGLTATMRGSATTANQGTPVGNVPGVDAGQPVTYSNAGPNVNMHAGSVLMGGVLAAANAGGGQSHDNRQPSLVLNYCIALQGVFPARS